ncbi:MAG: hypothetical protein L6Q38_17355 [Nitrospira sp.]|nr:hypothetical protein [Nitrospira sp.]
MAKMRGVAEFPDLWERRTTLQGEDGMIYELMSLSDLVQAKKTQCDKDWPMIRRLIEADRVACQGTPAPEQALFWLREGRTPELLIELARQFPDEAGIETGLAEVERAERAADRAYWEPLKKELERMRHA